METFDVWNALSESLVSEDVYRGDFVGNHARRDLAWLRKWSAETHCFAYNTLH
ncbi:hypothetical protein CI41S_21100 [Bradyrhizobium ivorense]|nr:hypothetical protein CI41S_21100 [Bradyrhizobium ivorense]